MLKVLDYLCAKHNIQYFVTGGTMLGAIRHKGFIPWDDDLDVGMTRANYEKFVKYAVPELPNDIFFQSDETDPPYPSAHFMEGKLRDKYSSYSTKLKRWHNGLQIDISVYDRAYLPHNFFIFLMNRSLKALKIKDKKRAGILKSIERYFPFPFVYSCSFIFQRKMIKLGTNYIRPKELSSLLKIKFEDMETYIPKGYHGYLKRRYGNYMEPPPEYKQKGQHNNDNYMQIFGSEESEDEYVSDPFRPCNHKEILHWKNRNLSSFVNK